MVSIFVLTFLFPGLIASVRAASDDGAAQTPESVSVIVFPGGFNWPIWVAQDEGYFGRAGIEVKLTNTPNSVFQLTSLIDGKFDIAMTAINIVVAYTESQGEAPIATTPDLFVFMGADNGLLSLATVVETFQDLKGRTLSVDAMTTGYAFVRFDLLKRNGLNQGDYKVEKAGGVGASQFLRCYRLNRLVRRHLSVEGNCYWGLPCYLRLSTIPRSTSRLIEAEHDLPQYQLCGEVLLSSNSIRAILLGQRPAPTCFVSRRRSGNH